MSLVDFIKLPHIRDIYKKHAIKTSMTLPLPSYLVPCGNTRLAGAIGTAFDYMVRFRLAALATTRGLNIVEGQWIAERAIESLMETEHAYFAPRWIKIMHAARKLQADNIREPVDPIRLARCSQFLGAADLLYRVGSFRPDFSVSDAITHELLALDQQMPYEKLLPTTGSIYLNPDLYSGRNVGGADPDIISGSSIIDIKTTIKPAADASRMRQICGYAVLCNEDGLIKDGERHMNAITHVGFMFSRQGISVEYSLEDIFRDGYMPFHEEFSGAIKDYAQSGGPSF